MTPYAGERLQDLGPPIDRALDRFARKATADVGDELKDRVVRHTPVAKPTPEIRRSYRDMEDWISSRGGRAPGTLKKSWMVGHVTIATGEHVHKVEVYTLDPVAPHVEYPTVAHVIRPKRAGGVLAIPTIHGTVFAKMVMHPGTSGSYMMATALSEVAVEWRSIVEAAWEREVRAHDFWQR